MAETLIFPEQTLEGVWEEQTWSWEVLPAPFALTVGETYRVVLDGAPHEVECADMNDLFTLEYYVMDASTGELRDGSFVIWYYPPESTGIEGGMVIAYVLDSTMAETHTLAVYQVEPEILLGDHTAADLAHARPDRLRVRTPEGGTTEYVHERLVPELLEAQTIEPDFSEGDYAFNLPAGMAFQSATIVKPETLLPENIREGVSIAGVEGAASIPEQVETAVELDFSGGDMTVTPDSGKAFSEVNISRPANLIAENIAEGVDIAGIVGTMAAGSGAGGAAVRSGVFTAKGTTAVIEHGLGVAPDFAAIFPHTPRSGIEIVYCFNYSQAYYTTHDVEGLMLTGSGISFTLNEEYRALDVVDSSGQLSSATETTMSVGGTAKLVSGERYTWVAISGLS